MDQHELLPPPDVKDGSVHWLRKAGHYPIERFTWLKRDDDGPWCRDGRLYTPNDLARLGWTYLSAADLTESDPAATPLPEQATAGLRYNEGKARYDLIPPEFMLALAEHYAAGARKYSEDNWLKGMSWRAVFASMMRHAWAWMAGEDEDQENGSHHMVAVAWNAIALYTYHKRGIAKDDRVRIAAPVAARIVAKGDGDAR